MDTASLATDGSVATTAAAPPGRDGVPDPAIEATDLVKRYGEVVAVAGVSLRVPRATIFAYLGRNGSGKTTTVRMLTTLSVPSAGTARVAGHDWYVAPAESARGRCPQNLDI